MIQLSGDEKEGYLSKIEKCLDKISGLDNPYSPESTNFRNFKNCFYFFHYNQNFGIKESIKIDGNSGFPLSTEFEELSVNKPIAKDMINNLPSFEKIVKNARDELLNSTLPKTQQTEYRKLKYFSDLSKTPVILSSIMKSASLKSKLEEGKLFNVAMEGFDNTKNTWTNYSIDVYQKGNGGIFSDTKISYDKDKKETSFSNKFNEFLEDCFSWGPDYIFKKMRENDLSPLKSRRVIIGPFYFSKINPPSEALKDLLMKNKDDFVFCCKYQAMEEQEIKEKNGKLEAKASNLSYDAPEMSSKDIIYCTPPIISNVKEIFKKSEIQFRKKVPGYEIRSI